MRFSLVLATINRTDELKRFLEALSQQPFPDYELLVVDQNEDDRVRAVIDAYPIPGKIVHLESSPGLSRARNHALLSLSGEIVSFPDDDCWYPEDLLTEVDGFFADHPEWDGLTGRSVDKNDLPSGGRWDDEAGMISARNVWRRATSYSIFLRKPSIERIGEFDETLGVGSGTPWGSGEDISYLLRAISSGYRVFYNPDIQVFHPKSIKQFNRDGLNKAYGYGLGMGRVLRMHNYSFWFSGYHFIRPLGGFFLAVLQGNSKRALYYLKSFQGRVRGWLAE